MPTLESLGIDRLTVDEKLALVHDLWDQIATELAQRPLSDAMKQEIDRRLANHAANPEAAIPWEQVEAEALARYGP
ncbi:MAG: addiction module protein [Gemmataceae bacterium]